MIWPLKASRVLGGVRQMLLIVDGKESPWAEALIFVRSNTEIEAMLNMEDAYALGADRDASSHS
jgi:hypothetical protein